MEKLSINDLKALKMYLAYIHDKEEAYKSLLTGRMFKGQFFLSQEEYHRLLKIEAIVIKELGNRK